MIRTSYELFMMQDKTRDPILIILQIYKVPVEIELDIGASLTLINRATYSKITCDSPATLEHSNAQLQTYNHFNPHRQMLYLFIESTS